MSEAVPQAVEAPCPECREETLHAVLHGRVGRKGGLTLDATVRCEECSRVHHVVLRGAPDVELPVVLSQGGTSSTTRLTLPGDDLLRVGDELLVDGVVVLVTGLERKDDRRSESARADEVRTLWAMHFESVRVRVAINLRKRTVANEIYADPDREFSVGQELVFGRLRVTVHGIKVKGGMRRRGTAAAREIVRVFAKPTRGETLETPPPPPEADAEGVRRERAASDVPADAEDAEGAELGEAEPDAAAWEELEEDEDTEDGR